MGNESTSDLAKLVIKRFPENRNMQLMCLRSPARFRCSRCYATRRAAMVAVIAEDWEKLLCVACYEKTLSEKPAEPVGEIIPKEWLGAVVSLRDAEKDNMIRGVPFGSQALDWADFKAAMLDGDEICEFSSPPDAPEELAGQAGYALVRDGAVVKYIATMMD